MPRFARVVIRQCPYHITQRGNAKRDIFFTGTDRQVYLGLLQQYAALRGVEVLGYCLMTNGQADAGGDHALLAIPQRD